MNPALYIMSQERDGEGEAAGKRKGIFENSLSLLMWNGKVSRIWVGSYRRLKIRTSV